MEIVKKGDFIELEFTGKSNGVIFDSNKEEDLKKIDKKDKPRKSIVIIGQGMVVKGFDKALDGKEIGKEYNVNLTYNEGFGPRMKNLVRTIPLKVFMQHKIVPEAGMSLVMDNSLVKIISVSGARVITDFNHPLAGKDLTYEFRIKRKVEDLKEKAEAFFESMFGVVPEIEIINEKIIVKGKKELEKVVELVRDQFKKVVGAELEFSFKDKEIEKEQVQ